MKIYLVVAAIQISLSLHFNGENIYFILFDYRIHSTLIQYLLHFNVLFNRAFIYPL